MCVCVCVCVCVCASARVSKLGDKGVRVAGMRCAAAGVPLVRVCVSVCSAVCNACMRTSVWKTSMHMYNT